MTILLAATDDGVARINLDRGEGDVQCRRIAESHATCIAAGHGLVLAGTFDDGAFVSGDGGRSWQPVGRGIVSPRVTAVCISPHRGGDGMPACLVGTEPSALYRSCDGAATWEELEELQEVPSKNTWSFPPWPWTHHVRWIEPSPAEPGMIACGIELGGLMRSTNGGRSWADHAPGAHRDVHQLATHRTTHGRMYEAAGEGAATSSDGGASWQVANAGLDRTYVWSVAADCDDADLWYVAASGGPAQAHDDERPSDAAVYRRDGGTGHWAPLGGHDQVVHPGMEVMPYALVAPAGRPRCLAAGLRDGSIALSEDAGDTWRVVAHGLPPVRALCELLQRDAALTR